MPKATKAQSYRRRSSRRSNAVDKCKTLALREKVVGPETPPQVPNSRFMSLSVWSQHITSLTSTNVKQLSVYCYIA